VAGLVTLQFGVQPDIGEQKWADWVINQWSGARRPENRGALDAVQRSKIGKKLEPWQPVGVYSFLLKSIA
jgi:hypothetical protein